MENKEMNKLEIAKLLIKHPEIKALYESRAFDASTINKVIAEEIMEADLSATQKDEIETLRSYLELYRKQASDIMKHLKYARLDGDEEGAEELTADLGEIRQKISNINKEIKAIQNSVQKAAQQAVKTDSPNDVQQVTQALKDTTDAMKPAVDAANSDADIQEKVDAVGSAVQNAADVAKDDLSDIEIVDDESDAADASSEETEENQPNPQNLKNKNTDNSPAVSSWSNFKRSLKQSNVEQKNELLKKAAENRLNAYQTAKSWEDLSKEPLNHKVPEGASEESFQDWKNSSFPQIENYFNGVLNRAEKVKPEEIETLADNIGDGIQIIDDSMNNVAGDDVSGDDVGDANVGGMTPAQEIRKVINDIDSQAEDFPTLLGNNKFVELLFAKLQAEPEESNNVAADNGVGDDVDGTATSSDTNIDSNVANGDVGSLEESLSGIYLAEEEGEGTNTSDGQDINAPEGSEEGGSAISVEDAKKLRDEIQRMKEIFAKSDKEKVNSIDVMDLAKQAFGEIPETSDAPTEVKSIEEVKEEAAETAEADSSLEQATLKDVYSKYIPSMNNFFEAPGRTKLGFMEQFLLRNQSELLWGLIAQLSEIAEIGEERAYNKSIEKEEAGVGPETEQEGNLQEGLIDSFFQRKKEPVTLSKEEQISLKTDIISLLKSIKQMKIYVSSYEENMTRVSANPALDGSSLEKKVQEYGAPLQQSIAKVVERAYVAHQNQTKTQYMNKKSLENDGDTSHESSGAENVNQVDAEITEALQGIILEDDKRQKAIEITERVYNAMRLIYMPEKEASESTGLQGHLANVKRVDARREAQKMLDIAKEPEFIKLYPGGKFGDKGVPVTIKEGISSLNEKIGELIEIVKDTVMLVKGETIPHGQLLKIFTNLTSISKTIEVYFGAKSLIKEDYQAEIQKFMAEEDEANKANTKNPVEPGSEASDIPSAESETDEKQLDSKDSPEDERVGKSEQQMNELIKVLKSENDPKVQTVLKEIGGLFPEEEDKALSVLIYYVFHRTGNLNENLEVTPSPKNVVNKFTDMMKGAQFLTKELREFISQNSSKIAILLTSEPVKRILEDTEGFFMKTLGNLLSKQADLRGDVQRMNSNTQGNHEHLAYDLEESLKPIIEKMLKEHYNY